MAFAIVLLAGEAAWADCTPAAANNVTATCTGTTTNQGGGAPGTSAGSTGYGNGGATGVTVNVIGGSLSGTIYGILVGDGTVTNNASITGGSLTEFSPTLALPMSPIPAASPAPLETALTLRPTRP